MCNSNTLYPTIFSLPFFYVQFTIFIIKFIEYIFIYVSGDFPFWTFTLCFMFFLMIKKRKNVNDLKYNQTEAFIDTIVESVPFSRSSCASSASNEARLQLNWFVHCTYIRMRYDRSHSECTKWNNDRRAHYYAVCAASINSLDHVRSLCDANNTFRTYCQLPYIIFSNLKCIARTNEKWMHPNLEYNNL